MTPRITGRTKKLAWCCAVNNNPQNHEAEPVWRQSWEFLSWETSEWMALGPCDSAPVSLISSWGSPHIKEGGPDTKVKVILHAYQKCTFDVKEGDGEKKKEI